MSIRRFFNRSRWDDERRRELDTYVEIETDENIARGLPPDEARRAALRKIGNRTLIREDIYQMNTVSLIDNAWRDLKYGARVLRLNPGFTIVAVLSLALGVGANTAIFQLLDAVQFRALPVKDPQQLVEILIPQGHRWGQVNGRRAQLTNAIWEQIRDRHQSFSGVFAWGVTRFDVAREGESRFIDGIWVSGSFFDVLGVPAAAGRVITEEDDVRGCGSPAAVISHAFWQREYGGAASTLGRTMYLDNRPFSIVGIMPPSFPGVEVGRTFDVAVPLCSEALVEPVQNALDKKFAWWLDVMGRLKPGVSLVQANAELNAMSPSVFAATVAPQSPPESAKEFLAYTLKAEPAGTGVSYLRSRYEQPLWLLLGIAGFVLLIACANLANLMLARASAREREIAVRLAIGASRGRLIRQLLAESVLVSAIGVVLGVLVAQSLSVFLVSFISTDNARLFFNLDTDWRVLAFATALGAGTCLLFGLAPALRATRQSAAAAMKAGARGSSDSRERFGLRRVLVCAQVALSFVLIVGAMLFVATVRNLSTLDPGFRYDDVLVADFDTRAAKVPPERQPEFQRQLRGRIAAMPGVEGVADAVVQPVSGNTWNDRVFIDGVKQQKLTNENHVSPGFFRLLDTALLAGRDFDERDVPGAPMVAIVNELFADTYYHRKDVIGRTFRLQVSPGSPDPTYQIVGIARNTKYAGLRDDLGPVAYFPEAQLPEPDPQLAEVLVLVRSRLPQMSLSASITAAARDVSPAMLVHYHLLTTDIRQSFLRERLVATLSAFFGVLAVLLAVIGLYGVMSYMVARRRNEIGIRMALGADSGDVTLMVMRDAMTLLAIGLAAGVLLALATAQTAKALLFGVTATDPATLALAAVTLGGVAAGASYLPAWRASRLSPTQALREE
jgi:predicted permease